MFEVGEPVWHSEYKRGVVAYSMPGDVRVMFDDHSRNPLVTTEPPMHIKKKDIEEASTEERVRLLKLREELKRKGTPLTGHVVEWHGGGQPDNRALTTYNYPLQDGFFKVLSVQQTFKGMKWDEKGPGKKVVTPPGAPSPAGERKFFPAEGLVDLKLEDTATGKKYTVQVNRTEYPAIYVALKVPENTLASLFDEGDLFWPTQSEEAPEGNEG